MVATAVTIPLHHRASPRSHDGGSRSTVKIQCKCRRPAQGTPTVPKINNKVHWEHATPPRTWS
eukprot:scaffold214405_cov35-Attheya_sp.AAC.1